MTDDALITLDEAAALIPGATAEAMKRHIRAGRLKGYRPGKAYLTTRADVRALIELTAVKVTPQTAMTPVRHQPTLPHRITEMELSGMALAAARTAARLKRDANKRKR